MNVMNFYIGDEKQILEEIRAWSAFALEKPNPYFNNLPSCPYAKKAWLDGKVGVIFKYGGSQSLYNTIVNFNDEFDLIILVDTFYKRDAQTFHEELERLNEAISEGMFNNADMWLMGFHPDDDSNDLIDEGDFEPHVNTPYAMTFVQRLTKVQEAAYNLKKLGYYDNYSQDYNVEAIFEQRETLYWRLKNGNESSKKNGNGRHQENARRRHG